MLICVGYSGARSRPASLAASPAFFSTNYFMLVFLIVGVRNLAFALCDLRAFSWQIICISTLAAGGLPFAAGRICPPFSGKPSNQLAFSAAPRAFSTAPRAR